MTESIKNRIAALEKQLLPESCRCLVELPDGTETETTLEEWYEHRKEWNWKRITSGGDVSAICLILAAIDNEIAEEAYEMGDMANAARLTASAARFLAEYERGVKH